MYILCKESFSDSSHFSKEEDGGGHEEEPQPVGEAERSDTEHVAKNVDDENLADEDDAGNAQETVAIVDGEICRCAQAVDKVKYQAAVGLEVAGIEEVPELHEYEKAEEEAQFVLAQVGFAA